MSTFEIQAQDERRSQEASGDALASYLSSIRHIPVLSLEETFALAEQMEEGEHAFRAALYAIPGTAVRVLERWRERRESDHVTGVLCTHYRDASGRDWSGYVDEVLARLEPLVAQRADLARAAGPGRARRRERLDARIAAGLDEAQLDLEVLFAIHREYRSLVSALGSLEMRRALGLTAPAARAALARAERALEGYHAAKQRFVRHNLRLVVTMAKKYRHLGVSFMDLIQEGNLGLVRAVEKFDRHRGFRFSSYAVWWITQSLIRVIQQHSRTVRVPSHLYELRYRHRSARRALGQRLGRAPTRDELAGELGIDPEVLERLSDAMKPIASLHAPLPGADDRTLEEVLPDERLEDPGEAIDSLQVRRTLERQLASLDSRERRILEWRFRLRGGPPLTLAEIGERLGLSRERVRQLEARALKQLRGRVEVAGLAASLDLEEVAEEPSHEAPPARLAS